MSVVLSDLQPLFAALGAKPALAAVYRYVGLSTTTRPTAAGDGSALADGTTFVEVDTGNVWVWAASTSTWYPQGFQGQTQDLYRALRDAIDAQTRVLQALWTELRAIRNSAGLQAGKPELPEGPPPTTETLPT